MEDKSVATDEYLEPLTATYLEVARLEAVLNGLVEHKVEAIKNEKSNKRLASSIWSSPNKRKDSSDRKRKRRKHEPIKYKKTSRSKQRVSTSSPESPRYGVGIARPLLHEDEAYLHSPCFCGEDVVEVINPAASYEDRDYISLKIDDLELDEEEEAERRRARRMRRRRRRKRRRRMKAQMASAVAVVENVKVIDPDELPQRAKWTIIATACLLLFMCLMLVGVTLRMAPLIDDMVRKENEELMNSLQRESNDETAIDDQIMSSAAPET
ncbi:PREDICTED: uncharacterized protein LOC108560357 [Nicrophorus vespilloides]|uniref:Uncharacterized protein LOC108560357 n=1 Tax=Nicrophorus vespilloides TaxID=110193 RepID=A0ABM1MFL0_NICVS|nr:PREDICTED: uncharacterized protein LOC108560357 [Nicrophorus vespilloides]